MLNHCGTNDMSKTTTDAQILPRFAPVRTWCKLSGIGKTRSYELMATGQIPTRKIGSSTLIDIPAGLAWIDSQPAAQLKTKTSP